MGTIIELMAFMSQQVTIYVGLLLLVLGIVGNVLNLIVFYFSKLKLLSVSPARLFLLTSTYTNLVLIMFPLLVSTLQLGFLPPSANPTSTNLFVCKFRFYVAQSGILIFLSCICFIAIDRYLLTCRQVKYREMSKMSTARICICVACIDALVNAMPIPVIFNISVIPGNQTAVNLNVCLFVNSAYSNYLSFFTYPILSGLLPLSILVLFGLLTLKNLQAIHRRRVEPTSTQEQQTITRRERSEYQMTRMALLQICTVFVSSVPFCTYSLYAAITAFQKSPARAAIEDFVYVTVQLLFYINQVSGFYIYFIASKQFRRQLKINSFKCTLVATTSRKRTSIEFIDNNSD